MSRKISNPHIFLTGEIQVGKSFIINHVLDELGGRISLSGFKTLGIGPEVRIFNPDGTVPCENNVVAMRGEGAKRGFPEVFDSVGVSLLQKKGELVLMDELGFFESDAFLFQKEVVSILDSDMLVLGVVKPKRTKFLDVVRGHSRVTVIEVTRENRKERFEEVLEIIGGGV